MRAWQCILGLSFGDVVMVLRSVKDSCTITFGRGINVVRALAVTSCKMRELEPKKYTALPKFVGVRKADSSIPGVVRVCTAVSVCMDARSGSLCC